MTCCTLLLGLVVPTAMLAALSGYRSTAAVRYTYRYATRNLRRDHSTSSSVSRASQF